MASVNKAILLGNCGRDPELRYVASGKAVCNFSLATSEKWTTKDGGKQEKTVWHNIVIWEKLAEIANQYLKKGSQVYLEGAIENRTYEDKEGVKKNISEVVVGMGGKMVLLGDSRARENGNDGAANGEGSQLPPAGQYAGSMQSSDSLPF